MTHTTTEAVPAATPTGWRGAAERLFVAAPAGSRPGRRAILLGVGAVLAGTVASLLRHPGTVALDTVYAEDGTIFLADAVNGSTSEAIASSYAGYYHLVPRLLGEVAAAFPAPAAAAVLAISAALVTSGLAVLVYVASAGHLRSQLARVLVAAPVVVAPLAQHEVPNSIANLHWPLLYAVFWMLVWTPPGRVGRVVAPALVALTALSDILIVAFLPLAAVRLVARRDRYSAVLTGLLMLGVLVQMSGLLTGSSSRDVVLSPEHPATGFLLRAVPAAVLGERWLPDAGADPRRLALAALAWLLLAVVVVVAARGLSQPRWVLAAAAGLQAVGVYVLPVLLTGVAPPRYALAPALLVLTAMVAMLHPGAGVAWRQRGAVPLLALAVLCVCVWTLNFRVDTPRDEGPRWGTELDRARTECATPAADAVRLPVTPNDPKWTAVLDCNYLTGPR